MTTKRKFLLLILPILMLACKTLFSGTAAKQPPATIVPTHSALKTSTPRPTTASAASVGADTPVPASKGFTLVRLDPGDGDLPELLAAEAQKAAALGQMPVVEFDAPW